MFATCTHTLESGNTCKSPAVRGTSLCFNHTPHENIKRQSPHQSEPFKLSKIHSKSGVIVAISEVLERFAQQQIKRSDARTFLQGLSLTARVMTDIDRAVAADPVRFEEPRAVPNPVAQPWPHLKPPGPASKSAAPWPASKEPQLVQLSPAPFNPLLKSMGVKNEPSFLSMLCANGEADATSRPTRRVHA
jgi:hypothetical protein